MTTLSDAFKQFDTTALTKVSNELIHAIPGDPTFIAHVGAILRAFIQSELSERKAKEASEEKPKTNGEPASEHAAGSPAPGAAWTPEHHVDPA